MMWNIFIKNINWLLLTIKILYTFKKHFALTIYVLILLTSTTWRKINLLKIAFWDVFGSLMERIHIHEMVYSVSDNVTHFNPSSAYMAAQFGMNLCRNVGYKCWIYAGFLMFLLLNII